MSRLRSVGCVAVLALTLACPPVRAQSRLDGLRRDTRGRSAASGQPAGSGSGGSDFWSGATSGNTDLQDLFALGVVTVVAATSPFWLPPLALDDNYDQSAVFPGRPYALPKA